MNKMRMRYLIIPLLFSILTICTNAVGQTDLPDSICAYTWDSNVNDCPNPLVCITDDWQGKVVDLPKNVNQIAQDTLKLCLSNSDLTKPVDIIYIMDLSASMYNAYWLNPSTDRFEFIAANVDTSNKTIHVPTGSPYWHLVGDPYRIRHKAIEAGFDYQYDSLPEGSTAGYIGFGGDINMANLSAFTNNHLQPLLNVKTNKPLLDGLVSDLQGDLEKNGAGTNYVNPLVKALEWFNNPNLSKNSERAIVFVSDGEPTSGIKGTTGFDQIINQLRAANVTVHGVFLGQSVGASLNYIANQTSGKTHQIKPTDAAEKLGEVVKSIVKSLVRDYRPVSLTLKNKNTNDSTVQRYTDKIATGNPPPLDSAWFFLMQNTIPLNSGMNDIAVKTTFRTQTPPIVDTTVEFEFVLNVDPNEPEKKECLHCWSRSKIEIMVSGNPRDTLTLNDPNYTVRLSYAGPDNFSSTQLTFARTKIDGESNTIRLDSVGFDGTNKIYEGTVKLNITENTTGANNNGETEATYDDILTVKWKHQKFEKEECSDTAFIVAPANKLSLYDNAGDPNQGNVKELNSQLTINADNSINLYAKVFANSRWLSQYENSSQGNDISWVLQTPTGGSVPNNHATIQSNNGPMNVFTPKRARQSYVVIANLTVNNKLLADTVTIYVTPGTPRQLTIEGTNDSTIADMFTAQHIPKFDIFSGEIDKKGYAILRDQWENWIGPVSNPQWNVEIGNTVTTSNGLSLGEGIFTRAGNGAGNSTVKATDPSFNLTNTTIVEVHDITITKLIISESSTNATESMGITLNTSESRMIYLWGQRSDNGQWQLVSGNWEINPPGVTETAAPQGVNKWNVQPKIPNQDTIKASFDFGNGKIHDDVPYTFTAAPAKEVIITLLTPEKDRVAGKTLLAEVRISNEDGLVPGITKYDGTGFGFASYSNGLGNGYITGYNPYVKTDQSQQNAVIANANQLAPTTQWFHDGIDTIEIVLYYASPNQEITVSLANNQSNSQTITGKTNKFTLLPGPLKRIEFDPNTQSYTKTFTDNPFQVVALGYDEFGNKLFNEINKTPLYGVQYQWTSDNSLVDFPINSKTHFVGITPAQATQTQAGNVTVSGWNSRNVTKSFFLQITGPMPTAEMSTSHDTNGNGYLDQIRIIVNNPTTNLNFETIKQSLSSFSVSYNNTEFTIESIEVNENPVNRTFFTITLNLKEEITNDPQTNWTPEVSYSNINQLKDYKGTAVDQAGPVLWGDAVQNRNGSSEFTDDIVTVYLSEDIRQVKGVGKTFNTSGTPPRLVLNAYETQSEPNPSDTLLDGISNFTNYEVKNENGKPRYKLSFVLTEGRSLSSKYLNLRPDDSTTHSIVDAVRPTKYNNLPNTPNRRIKVKSTSLIDTTVVGPNPILPDLKNHKKFSKNKKLKTIDAITGEKLIKQGGGVIKVSVDLSDFDGSLKMPIKLIIHDLVGNVVFYKETDNAIPQEWYDDPSKYTGKQNFYFYWPGYTYSSKNHGAEGRKCAPGVYRMLLTGSVEQKGEEPYAFLEETTLAVRN